MPEEKKRWRMYRKAQPAVEPIPPLEEFNISTGCGILPTIGPENQAGSPYKYQVTDKYGTWTYQFTNKAAVYDTCWKVFDGDKNTCANVRAGTSTSATGGISITFPEKVSIAPMEHGIIISDLSSANKNQKMSYSINWLDADGKSIMLDTGSASYYTDKDTYACNHNISKHNTYAKRINITFSTSSGFNTSQYYFCYHYALRRGLIKYEG